MEIFKIIYEGGNQNIIKYIEQELKFWKNHSNYQTVHDIFKLIKCHYMQQQFNKLSIDSKPQQQYQNYNVIENEIDLFKSVQNHSTNLSNQIQKRLVEYDNGDIQIISKKNKLN
ncbi:unnamed protein product [Paramecium primaurelia]|uniref:Uncharacterized protein n=1 Tax=Paramecium primaurelia TaxID=5886 RepID=A0A8S1KRT7_PARPR|nr:unnamed protein product [Paramecium primaurelia]